MPLTKLTPAQSKILESVFAFFAQMTEDKYLDIFADQETRICLLELGL